MMLWQGKPKAALITLAVLTVCLASCGAGALKERRANQEVWDGYLSLQAGVCMEPQ
jgi:hypothetical protein